MSSYPMEEKYLNLPGNPRVLSVVDYGSYRVFGTNFQSWVMLNRPLTVAETSMPIARTGPLPPPQLVNGSLKMGQPIKHPKWTVHGGIVTMSAILTGAYTRKVHFTNWTTASPGWSSEWVVPLWKFQAAPALYIPIGPAIRMTDNMGHRRPGA